ncbi:nicotinate phosphoribosyltransferase [Miniphocaeibacter massiliensis]|uniref:nicotinate phosphoribosyltransferase n=1 Tax=Miniphocaeibacter massiliensis TaxID=2041841 RepID=UPI001F5C1D99|nr:nicotinate phosphoribosyltransferase [Miniphocaeibacter massiliensis]
MNWKITHNLTMLSDFYEFTMANGYLEKNKENVITYFDLYFRNVPDNGGFAIVAGLEQFIKYIKNLKFEKHEIDYFKNKNIFSDKFINYLENFDFKCDIWAMPEGSIAFPNEPLMVVRGPAVQAQFIETMALLCLNHQTLIATKANRIVRAAEGRAIMEFGARRAQGPDAATFGARAAYIGGVAGTSNTLTDLLYGVPALGTMAHSWVMMFENEYEAFKAYAETFPDDVTLLVDTYDTLKEGVPNAIKVFDNILKPLGKRPKAIRLDSGDIAYISKQARVMLDNAGYEDCKIVASNALDEYKIRGLIDQGAKVNTFGVGERLITSKSNPVFGGVYKLVAIEDGDEIIPKIKISENVEKITTPGFKQIYRLYDNATKKAEADLVCLSDETIDESKPLEIFHPIHTWKRKTLTNFTAKPLLIPIFKEGEFVYNAPSLNNIRTFCQNELETLWDEVKRFEYPHLYIVDLSQELWDLKRNLLSNRNK